jgi:hypothetical protein
MKKDLEQLRQESECSVPCRLACGAWQRQQCHPRRGGDALEKEAVVIASCRIATAASASMMVAEADSSSRRRVMARMRVRALAGFFSAA